MKHGFVRVAAAVPEVKIAGCNSNIERIIALTAEAIEQQVEIICFPELSVTGYTCGDLFHQHKLLTKAEEALGKLLLFSCDTGIIIIVGMPFRNGNQLFNTAVVIQQGRVLGIVPKTHLPNHNEFYEKRWFASSIQAQHTMVEVCGQQVDFGTDLIFNYGPIRLGLEICEDLWVPVPPGTQAALQGATLIFNLSATNELAGKHTYLRQLIEQQSARTHSAYIYASAGNGESSTDLVFTGNALIAENGHILASSNRFSRMEQLIITEIDTDRLLSERLKNTNFFNDRNEKLYRQVSAQFSDINFSELNRPVHPHPFIPPAKHLEEACDEILSIQAAGLAQRWKHTQAKTLVAGISGGLDSTLALLVCVKAADELNYDRKRIIGITMPGFGTTGRTYNNAVKLIEKLGVSFREINITSAALQHFKDIGHNPEVHDVIYENTQARERTQVLMDVANQTGGLVVGTGDLSELALGWATYNGDHMSMYGVNGGVPKTLVRYLVNFASGQADEETRHLLQDILSTPVSPELLPASTDGNISQKTEDIVGPYELHDFFLYYMIRFGFSPEKIYFLAQKAFNENYKPDTIRHWLNVFMRRFFAQQFKRSCMPDGPKVGSINLSPRGDWRMPSDAVWDDWKS